MDAQAGRKPESYTWPLLTVLLVILPQVLIPAGNRVGPPLLVPLVEGAALLVLVGIPIAGLYLFAVVTPVWIVFVVGALWPILGRVSTLPEGSA